MRNFKKILPRILLILVFLCIFNMGIRYTYESVRNTMVYTRNDLRDTKGEIETLVLGTSLTHWGIDSNVLGETIGSEAFNLSTSAQPLSGSYYLLKDQARVNPIKRVFLGIHVPALVNDTNTEGIEIREGIFDRMLSPVVKAEYLFKTAAPNEYERYLFYAARVENVLNERVAKRNLDYKKTEDFKNNIGPEEQMDYVYLGNGNENTMAEYDGSFDDEELGEDATWERSKVLPVNEEYMQKIADFCKKEGIELNIVVTPMTWEFTKLMGDLENFHEYLQDFCDENGAQLFDFHEYENVFEIFTNEDYQDKKHFNAKGAEKFAQLLGEWYLEEEE